MINAILRVLLLSKSGRPASSGALALVWLALMQAQVRICALEELEQVAHMHPACRVHLFAGVLLYGSAHVLKVEGVLSYAVVEADGHALCSMLFLQEEFVWNVRHFDVAAISVKMACACLQALGCYTQTLPVAASCVR